MTATNQSVPAPTADRRPVERTFHGRARTDEYAWMSGDPEALRAHLQAENEYSGQAFEPLRDLAQTIFSEIAARTQQSDITVPTPNLRWWYYTRSKAGHEHPIYCRAPRSPHAADVPPAPPVAGVALPDEQVLLDGNKLAGGTGSFAVGTFRVSPDERYLAYSLDVAGTERFVLRVKDLDIGTEIDAPIHNAYYTCAWSQASDYLFYVVVDEAQRPYRLMRHRIGTDADDDVLLFDEPDAGFWVQISPSHSTRYLCLRTSSAVTSEVWLLDAATPTAQFRPFRRRRPGVYYHVEHQPRVGREDRFLVLHNEGAPNFAVSCGGFDDAPWTPFMESGEDRLLWVTAFAHHLVVFYRRGLANRLRVLDDDDRGREIVFPDEVYTMAPASNPLFDTTRFRLSYASPVQPDGIYELGLDSGELTLLRSRPVLPRPDGKPFDPADYQVVQEWAVTDDGTRVPITLVTAATAVPDGRSGCVLYGYGAYERAADMGFSIQRLSLVDRGVSYAVAHVRGGGDLGASWHDAARGATKKRSFSDFLSCARRLVDQRWTSPDRLVARGSSAGGLLVAAAVNQDPTAFGGVLARVPFVDPLTSMLDETEPLTVTERDEWGDPLNSADAFDYLRSYAPYDNIRATWYPPVLAIASMNDTRVRVHEAAKWIARLRATAHGGPFLLRTTFEAGHRGRTGRYEAWRDEAMVHAWIITTVHDAVARSTDLES